MVQILCPRLGWFLLQATYLWEGENKSCTLIGHATTALVAEKLQCIRQSYPSTHVALLKKDGTLATAGGLFKWSPHHDKLKLWHVVNCSVELVAKADSTRAGMYRSEVRV